jgi:hypothetical protein
MVRIRNQKGAYTGPRGTERSNDISESATATPAKHKAKRLGKTSSKSKGVRKDRVIEDWEDDVREDVQVSGPSSENVSALVAIIIPTLGSSFVARSPLSRKTSRSSSKN